MWTNVSQNLNGGDNGPIKEDEKVRAVLVLQDGTRFEGYSFGAMSNTSGEIGNYASNLITFVHQII